MTLPIEHYLPGSLPYTQGRGKVFLRKDTDTVWHDLFHCSEFKLMTTTEELKHENVSGGLKYVDASKVQKIEVTGSLVIDVLLSEAIRQFFFGEAPTEVAQTSGTWTAEEFTVVEVGKWHELGKKQITMSAITDDTSPTPVALVENTDYQIDLKNGLFLPLPGSTKVGTIGDKYRITGTYATHSAKRIKAGGNPSSKMHIMFLGDPSIGKRFNVYCFASMRSSGDFTFIADEWAKLTFEFTCNEHVDYGRYGCMIDEEEVITD